MEWAVWGEAHASGRIDDSALARGELSLAKQYILGARKKGARETQS